LKDLESKSIREKTKTVDFDKSSVGRASDYKDTKKNISRSRIKNKQDQNKLTSTQP